MTWAVAGWALVAVAGFLVALAASREVADHATRLVQATNLSPFVVGLVLLSIGTDLPEIANSLITSASGHGDLNVGDSIGSTFTQLTLVLGLVPFLAGRIELDGRAVQAVGSLTVAALLVGVLLIGDGRLDRVDGMVLVGGWFLAMILTRNLSPQQRTKTITQGPGRRLGHILAALGFLAVVAVGATGAVIAMVRIAEAIGAPEYFISFFGASIGTSLPELIVDVTAIRQGAAELAIGDVFGSSLVDATLSVGIGPTFFPTVIDTATAVRGGLFVGVAVALITMLLSWTRNHNRGTGTILLLIYAASYLVILR